jgi:hypothetical protein
MRIKGVTRFEHDMLCPIIVSPVFHAKKRPDVTGELATSLLVTPYRMSSEL